jgi:hypothetical protein
MAEDDRGGGDLANAIYGSGGDLANAIYGNDVETGVRGSGSNLSSSELSKLKI